MSKNIVFIDSRVAGYETLIASLSADSEWHLLDAAQDGLDQMQRVLEGRSGLDSIHIVSHGSAGTLYLGSTVLNSASLANYQSQLQAIGSSLSETGDILLYGCNVAQGDAGASFVNSLAQITEADVAASTDATGADTTGGNMTMEVQFGTIGAMPLALPLEGEILAVNTTPIFRKPGSAGKVVVDVNGQRDYGQSVTVQPDGKILVAGTAYNGNFSYFALVRYNADGTLDTSLSDDGIVTTGIRTNSYDAAYSVALQPDGKIIVVGVNGNTNNGNSDFALVRYNADGSLDNSFSDSGIVTTDLSLGDCGLSLALQPDGKILVAGRSYNDSGSLDFTLFRYNADGKLDTSFSVDGIVATTMYGAWASSIALQPDGKILVAGNSGSYSEFTLVRYNADGGLDTGFSGDGIVTTDIGTWHDYGQSVTVQPDGKILVVGTAYNGNFSYFALVRYNADGTLDTSFSDDGIVTTDIPTNAYNAAYSVALQSDGKILVAGRTYDGRYDFALVRYNVDGTLDTSFSVDGIVTTGFATSSSDEAYSVTVQPDGKILVVGSSSDDSGNSDFALVRYNADGSLDASLGNSLYGVSTLGGSVLYTGSSVVLDSDVQIDDAELETASSFSGATLTLSRHGGANASDVFAATGSLSELVSGKYFRVGDVTVGLVLSNANGALKLGFNSGATQALVSSAMQQITYANSSNLPSEPVNIDWEFNDGNTGAQGTGGDMSTIGYTTVNFNIATPALHHALPDFNVLTNIPFNFVIPDDAFIDADRGDQLSYEIRMADGSALPSWLLFDPQSRTLFGNPGTPGIFDLLQFDIAVFVKDGVARQCTDVFRLGITLSNNAPTGSVTITGTPIQGETLIASNTLADADGIGPINYIWQGSSDGVMWTTVGTGETLTLGQSEVAKQIRVQASYIDDANTLENVSSVVTETVANISGAPTGTVIVSGVLEQGQTLMASNSLNDANGMGVVNYTWQSSAKGGQWTTIGTGMTLTLSQAEADARILVLASYADGSKTLESRSSSVTDVVANVNDSPQGSVLISGVFKQGQILTVSNTLSDADGLGVVSYTWQSSADGQNWSTLGITETLTLSQAEVAKQIRVVASYTDGYGTTESVNSPASDLVANDNDAPTFLFGDGIVTAIDTGTYIVAYGATRQPDGKILVAGTGGLGFALMRYNSDGSLDTSFSDDGIAIGTSTYVSARSVALQPDGKILVAGSSSNGDSDFALVRYNADGGLDTSFSGDGIVTTDVGPWHDYGLSIALQPDGKVVVAGSALVGYYWYFALVRYNADGSLDSNFSDNGRLISGYFVNNSTSPQSVVLLPDGKILVAGTMSSWGAPQNFNLMRYNLDGSVDTSVSTAFFTSDIHQRSTANSIALQPDGKILVAGLSYNGSGNTDFALARYNVDLSLDISFSGDGKLITDIGMGYDEAQSIALQPDGKILVAGNSVFGDKSYIALARYNPNGILDVSFSDDGIVTTEISAGGLGCSVMVQHDGKIVVTSGNSSDFALVRYNADGSLDTTFDSVAQTVNNAAIYTENAAPIALDTNVVISDVDLDLIGNFAGSFITLSRHGGANAEDVFSTTDANLSALIDDSSLIRLGAVIGTVTQNSAGVLSIQFSENADQSIVNEVLSSFGYSNTSDDPAPFVQIDWTFNDGNIGAQGEGDALATTASTTISITPVNDAPTGSVTISGLATQGQKLTASNTLTDADGMGTVSYQWLADDQIIPDATDSTLVLGQAQVGKAISVVASYTDGFGTSERITSAATSAIANINDTPIGVISINGTVQQGQTLTASNTLADADGIGSISYQWKANGQAISDASDSTLLLTQDQVGKNITVVASYTDGFGASESKTSAATTTVTNINDAPSGNVTITGTATQGQTLTAAHTLADVDGMGTVSYQWKAGGTNISGATNSTLTLTQAQVDKAISVVASYTDALGTHESVSSTSTEAVANTNDVPTGALTITGSAIQGQTLIAVSSLADADGLGEFEYQWLANGLAIADATGNTLSLTQALVGKTISVTASYTDGFGTAESKSSIDTATVANVNDAPSGNVTISGTLIQGETLTVANTLVDADGMGAVSYQWQANGINISGATGSTFTLTQVQVGKAIRVVASYTDGFGRLESKTSAATGTVANVNDAPVGAVTIAGTATQGQTLTVSNTLADADGMGTVSYQWKANGTDINGATDSSYTLTQAQVGKTISVTASFTDKLGAAESATSSATATVVNVNDAGTVAVSGKAIQKQVLTATVTDIDGVPATGVTYQWLANGVAISGAASKFLMLGQDQVGKTIAVKVSYTDGQGSVESKTSAATLAVANVNDAPIGTVSIAGTTTQGQKLTAANTLTDVDGLDTISYQWKANGTTISGATSSSYTLKQSEVGKTITVTASYTDGQGTAESKTSAATSTVANVNDLPSGTVTISGTATQGQKLTATNTLADVDGLGVISYQWKANGTAISGATNSTYTLTQAVVGKTITVTASYTDGQGTAESKTSAATKAVLNGLTVGTTGNDTLMGTYGADKMTGQTGNDIYYVNHASDVITEAVGGGIDTVYSYLSSYTLAAPNVENGRLMSSTSATLIGNGLANTLVGNAGNDVLNGVGGNDILRGGTGKDILDGGAGTDTADYSDKSVAVVATLNGATAVSVKVSGVIEDSIKNIENLSGGSAADSLTGDTLANTLVGNAGNDVLKGMGGKDTLDGGTGADTADYSDKSVAVVATLNGATAVSVKVGGVAEDSIKNIENLSGGSASDNLTGDTLANTLVGNAGNDILRGGLGNDILTGGTGQDFFRFDAALNRTSNVDRITDFSAIDDTIQLENLIFTKFGSTTTGTLSINYFKAIATGGATDSNDYIVYNKTTGALYYDADGGADGNTDGIQFATVALVGTAPLTNADFVLI